MNSPTSWQRHQLNIKPLMRQQTQTYNTSEFVSEAQGDNTPFELGAIRGYHKKSPMNSLRKRLSPQLSPKSGQIALNSHLNIELRRLKTGYLDEDIVYDSLQKVDLFLKHQQILREDDKSNSYDREQENMSPMVRRNVELMKRIQKYQNDKGMTPAAKETKFEKNFKEFRRLKTFVNVQGVMRDLSDPSKVHSVEKAIPESTKHSSAFRDTREPPKSTSRFSEAKSLSPPPFGSDEKVSLFALSKTKDSLRFDSKFRSLDEEGREKEHVDEIQNLVHENIKRHIGPQALDTIQTKLADPKKQKEIRSKNRLDMQKIRESKKALRNNELLNSLIDHLAAQNKPEGQKLIEDEDGPAPSPFYQKFEREINRVKDEFDDEEEIEEEEYEFDADVEREAYKRGLAQKLKTDSLLLKLRLNKKVEVLDKKEDEVNKNNENDDQTKVVALLDSYRERSKKILRLLKKQAEKIHKKDHRKEIQSSSSRKDSLFKPLKEPAKVSTDAQNEENILSTDGNLNKEGSGPKKLLRIAVPAEQDPFVPRSIHASVSAKNDDRVYRNRVLNPRQHKHVNEKQMTDTNFLTVATKMDSTGISSTSHRAQLGPRRCCTKVKERTYETKATKSYFSLEKSLELEGIKGLLSNLSVTNKQIETELKNSIKDAEMFYSEKISNMRNTGFPDSLKLSTKPESDNSTKKTSLIMKLTSKALRDQVL